MLHNNVEISVQINGRHTADEYISPIDRQTYIEGRDGSEFTLVLKNRNAFRVLAIPSVDGLSVLDGNERIAVGKNPAGVDSATAAKFVFAGDKGGSYAEKSGHGAVNKGVIGLMAFKEDKPQPTYHARSYGTLGSGEPMFGATRSMSRGMSKGLGDGRARGIAPPSGMMASAAPQSLDWDNAMGDAIDTATASQTLGTGFGDATKFDTVKVEFKRGDLLSTMVIYYDDRRSLRRRGIILDHAGRQETRPSAFPAAQTGCVPPADWKR